MALEENSNVIPFKKVNLKMVLQLAFQELSQTKEISTADGMI